MQSTQKVDILHLKSTDGKIQSRRGFIQIQSRRGFIQYFTLEGFTYTNVFRFS